MKHLCIVHQTCGDTFCPICAATKQLREELAALEQKLDLQATDLEETGEENRRLRAANKSLVDALRDMTKVAYEVPLCADHASTWFTARYFNDGDCWFCQQTDAVKPLVDVLRGIADADWRKWDVEMQNAGEFVNWAKSRARAALAPYDK